MNYEEVHQHEKAQEKYQEYLADENYKYQTKERLVDVGFKKRKNRIAEIFMSGYLNLTIFLNSIVRKF